MIALVLIWGEAANLFAAQGALAPSPDVYWEIFANRSSINALLADGDYLWAGTDGGLEKRDMDTGELLRVFTTLDSLPDNGIRCLISDGAGGLWIGTEDGLAHYNGDGDWEVFTPYNSNMPNSYIESLISDGAGGLWVGTYGGGLAHYDGKDNWKAFTIHNSSLPDNYIEALLSDGEGGVWIVTTNGALTHYHKDGAWQLFNKDNSGLPSDAIWCLLSDGTGGLWIGTWKGLVYYSKNGSWKVLNEDNSDLPSDNVWSLAADGAGGLWIGTDDGLAHYDKNGRWKVFNRDNSPMSENGVLSLISDGAGGVWIGTRDGGLLHYDRDGRWEAFNDNKSAISDNIVVSLSSDEAGGVWAGTGGSGLAHYDKNGGWSVFNKENSPVSDYVFSLLSDGSGGIWAGTGDGLMHYDKNGRWQVFNMDNSVLPANSVVSMSSDGAGGIWIGTGWGGMVHYDKNGRWQVFNKDNSDMPDNNVLSLLSDGSGGVWIGTQYGGLAHYDKNGRWQVFNRENSGLPNAIWSLLSDGKGGLWIGTAEGLIYYDKNWRGQVFNKDNSVLPSNRVNTLLSDGSGGIWIGTQGGGLAHYGVDGTWKVFNRDNSGLPYNDVTAMSSDGAGGVWIGTNGAGLAHMTFSSKERIAETITDESQKEELLHGKRAAIIVHPRGMKHGRKQFVAIETMATYAYKTLLARGYDNSEIYFLSYKPDIDITGDGMADMNVVDGPVGLSKMRSGESPKDIAMEDIERAFSWAKEKGTLDEPLLFIFVDHGGEDKLILSPENKTLDAQTLKRLFDDYQSLTGNAIIAILEACYSGSLVDELSGSNRVIITSTGENSRANYADLGYQSFARFFFDNLRKGLDFEEAFTLTKEKLPVLGYPFTSQTPLLDDDGDGIPNTSRDGSFASEYCLNGCFGGLAGEVVLEPLGIASVQEVTQGEQVELKVRASITEGSIRRVRAVIRTPQSYHSIDEFGFPTIPPIVKSLTKGDDGIWSGSFSGFDYKGEYYLTFTVEDQDGFVSQSESAITFALKDGKELDMSQMEETAEEEVSKAPENGHEMTPEVKIEIAYPVLNAVEYHYGDTLTITVPDAPDGVFQYVAIGLPDGSIYFFTGKNMAKPFTGGELSVWEGGDTVLDITLGPPFGVSLPFGKYTVYLLRIQAGLDPLTNYDAWRLGALEFIVVKEMVIN